MELPTSEQIWRPPLGEANPFLPNRGFKTQAGWQPFVPEGGLLFSPPTLPLQMRTSLFSRLFNTLPILVQRPTRLAQALTGRDGQPALKSKG